MNEFLFTDDPSAVAGKNTLCLHVPTALADKRAVLAWYAEALSFPSYFGANWDAFSECIRDLAWLAPSNIVIAHGDLPMAGYPSDQDIYLDVLADAVLDWKGDAARHFKVTFPTKVMRALDNRMIVVGRHMSTRDLILRSFPDGVPDEDYPALIWVLDDAQMSQRSIATALAASGVKDYTVALNDILGVLAAREPYEAAGRAIIEKMKPYGYDDWLAEGDTPRSQVHLMRALKQMHTLLRDGGEKRGAQLIARILKLNYGSDEFWSAVTSLEIWGGAGSLFDQAFVKNSEDSLRLQFNRALLELGGLIEKEGRSTHFVRSANMVLRQWVKK